MMNKQLTPALLFLLFFDTALIALLQPLDGLLPALLDGPWPRIGLAVVIAAPLTMAALAALVVHRRGARDRAERPDGRSVDLQRAR